MDIRPIDPSLLGFTHLQAPGLIESLGGLLPHFRARVRLETHGENAGHVVLEIWQPPHSRLVATFKFATFCLTSGLPLGLHDACDVIAVEDVLAQIMLHAGHPIDPALRPESAELTFRHGKLCDFKIEEPALISS